LVKSMSDENKFIAGEIVQLGEYESYLPNLINQQKFDLKDKRIFTLLEEASYRLGRLNALCHSVPFFNLFVNMHVLLEALSSSKIEGTKAEVEELLFYEKNEKQKLNVNSELIDNLFSTIHHVYKNKSDFSIFSTEFLEDINKRLFINIHPQNKYSGKVRNVQNFIGGNSIKDAAFIPPPHYEVKKLLNDLNDFWQNKQLQLPDLVKIAICHYQFETIHPFLDGNGRIGRLLINLQLRESGKLCFPVLCLSEYFRKNKGFYYEALTNTRFSHDIEHWIRFFLNAVNESTKERIRTLIKIIDLRNKYAEEINKTVKNPTNHFSLLHYLIEKSPYITVKDVQTKLEITYQGANKLIDTFTKLGILSLGGENKRNRTFVFKEYYDLFFIEEKDDQPKQDVDDCCIGIH